MMRELIRVVCAGFHQSGGLSLQIFVKFTVLHFKAPTQQVLMTGKKRSEKMVQVSFLFCFFTFKTWYGIAAICLMRPDSVGVVV